MVEMNMHRCDLQIMMRVMRTGQPSRQFPCVVVEDIGQGRNALTGRVVIDPRALETETRKIADGLGAVLIAIVFHERSKFGGEFVGHADGDALHLLSFPILPLHDQRYDVSSIFSYIDGTNKGPSAGRWRVGWRGRDCAAPQLVCPS